jgi:hypothetical protein
MPQALAPMPAWAIQGKHILPLNDLRPHTLSDCWCQPADDDGVIVHNSMDQRERYERGEAKAS